MELEPLISAVPVWPWADPEVEEDGAVEQGQQQCLSVEQAAVVLLSPNPSKRVQP